MPADWSLLLTGFVAGLVGGRLLPRRGAGVRAPADGDPAATAAAVDAERERILRDLHDDLGARLLQLVYAAPNEAFADQARAALQDLRDVASRARRGAAPLEDVLFEIEAEARQRLAGAGIELAWQQPDTLPALTLDDRRALHLYRIVREAISNALRHAGARTLRIRLKVLPQLLALELTDDGRGLSAEAGGAGRGVASMRERAEQLHGAIRWTRGTAGGTKVVLTLPLDGDQGDHAELG